MNKKRIRQDPDAVSFAQARDELFSHVLRCGVIDALPEHQKDWFDDTMLYLADRYEKAPQAFLASLRNHLRKSTPAAAIGAIAATRSAKPASSRHFAGSIYRSKRSVPRSPTPPAK